MDIREHYVTELPQILEPSAKYFVLDNTTGSFTVFIVSINGEAKPAGYVTLSQLEASSFMPISDFGLIGTLDGSNKRFSTQNLRTFIPGTANLYVNGIRQFKSIDYIEYSNDTIELSMAPVADDLLILDYLTNISNQ